MLRTLTIHHPSGMGAHRAPYSPTSRAVYLCWGSKGHWPFPSRRGCPLPLGTSVKFSRCCGKGEKNQPKE